MNSRMELSQFMGPRNYQAPKLIWTPGLENEELRLKHEKVQDFQKTKDALYLYTARESDRWWEPHLNFIADVVRPPSTVLNYYAATGWIGLQMRAGLTVDYVDYQTRCTDFLEWRLKSRGGGGEVYNLRDDIPAHDAVVCIDGAWRHTDPLHLVNKLATLGDLVVLDLDTRLVYDVIGSLDFISKTYGIVSHRVANHYVNLVAFRTGAVVDEGQLDELADES